MSIWTNSGIHTGVLLAQGGFKTMGWLNRNCIDRYKPFMAYMHDTTFI